MNGLAREAIACAETGFTGKGTIHNKLFRCLVRFSPEGPRKPYRKLPRRQSRCRGNELFGHFIGDGKVWLQPAIDYYPHYV